MLWFLPMMQFCWLHYAVTSSAHEGIEGQELPVGGTLDGFTMDLPISCSLGFKVSQGECKIWFEIDVLIRVASAVKPAGSW